MTANLGSTTQRNIPDVALTADNVTAYHADGSIDVFGGTSCAAPLWAGFMALVNQQAASLAMPRPASSTRPFMPSARGRTPITAMPPVSTTRPAAIIFGPRVRRIIRPWRDTIFAPAGEHPTGRP